MVIAYRHNVRERSLQRRDNFFTNLPEEGYFGDIYLTRTFPRKHYEKIYWVVTRSGKGNNKKKIRQMALSIGNMPPVKLT